MRCQFVLDKSLKHTRVLERDMKRIQQSRQHLYEVNMGATAVGTGLNADPEYIEAVVKHLGAISELPLVGAEDLVDATQNTDAYTEVSAALKVCMMNMSKIANDLRLMASGTCWFSGNYIYQLVNQVHRLCQESKPCYARGN